MKRAVKLRRVFLLVFLFSVSVSKISQASLAGTGGELSGELLEDGDLGMEEEEWEEALSGDGSDEELKRLMEEYFREMESEDLELGQPEVEKIVDPPMAVELKEGKLCYRFPNLGYFTSNIPRGMVSSQPVELSLSSGCVAIADYEGTVATLSGSRRFTEEGNYQVKILSYQAPEEMAEDYHLYEANFCFTIVGGKDGRLGAVPAPEGFSITQVLLDGKPQKVANPRCFFLGEDGNYAVTYQALAFPGLELSTAFVRDTTAPFLSFSPEPENHAVFGMAEFFPSEPDCKVYLNYNGEQGYAISSQLTVAGHYRLRIEDDVGNGREYHLQIKTNYRLIDGRIIGIGAAALVLAGVWMVFLRKNMRVL